MLNNNSNIGKSGFLKLNQQVNVGKVESNKLGPIKVGGNIPKIEEPTIEQPAIEKLRKPKFKGSFPDQETFWEAYKNKSYQGKRFIVKLQDTVEIAGRIYFMGHNDTLIGFK